MATEKKATKKATTKKPATKKAVKPAAKTTAKKATTKTTKAKVTTTSTGENRRKLIGVVAKRSGDKTISVTVERFIKHPVYGKFYRSSKNYATHDAENAAGVGDRVEITEANPVSKTKRFTLSNIIKSAEATT